MVTVASRLAGLFPVWNVQPAQGADKALVRFGGLWFRGLSCGCVSEPSSRYL